jgi:hypothetical protein
MIGKHRTGQAGDGLRARSRDGQSAGAQGQDAPPWVKDLIRMRRVGVWCRPERLQSRRGSVAAYYPRSLGRSAREQDCSTGRDHPAGCVVAPVVSLRGVPGRYDSAVGHVRCT